jgi:hypothetical protein
MHTNPNSGGDLVAVECEFVLFGIVLIIIVLSLVFVCGSKI